MKKLLLLPALLIGGAARAQTNVVKVDVFQPILNTLALSFEHKLSPSSSFQLGVAGMFNYPQDKYYDYNSARSERPTTSGFSITPEYRLYLSDKHESPEGFYVAPFLRYQYQRTTGNYGDYDPYTGTTYLVQPYEASLNAFGLGVIVGKHWIFKQRFSLDIYTGPGFTFSSISSDRPGYKLRRSDFVGQIDTDNNYDFRGGVTFGVAF